MNICKRCKKSLENHVIAAANGEPFWCLRENEIMSPIQAGWNFIPMDNLDYIEWVAKQKNLV